jgi:predicted Rossmann fold flavoprotein
LSGPAILQISSYWSPGESIVIDLLSGGDMTQALKQGRYDTPKMKAAKFLGAYLPARVVEEIFALAGMAGEGERNLADYSDKKIAALGAIIHGWRVKPNGSEGYRTAEVTKGGVNTDEIDAKTFESRKCPSLYFIGEVLDVTGHLGGHNFQWAWASGYCCGREI